MQYSINIVKTFNNGILERTLKHNLALVCSLKIMEYKRKTRRSKTFLI